MYMYGNDSLWSSARAVCVVQLVSMADSRTERLHKLLPASNSHHLYVPYPAIVDVCGLSKEIDAALE